MRTDEKNDSNGRKGRNHLVRLNSIDQFKGVCQAFCTDSEMPHFSAIKTQVRFRFSNPQSEQTIPLLCIADSSTDSHAPAGQHKRQVRGHDEMVKLEVQQTECLRGENEGNFGSERSTYVSDWRSHPSILINPIERNWLKKNKKHSI